MYISFIVGTKLKRLIWTHPTTTIQNQPICSHLSFTEYASLFAGLRGDSANLSMTSCLQNNTTNYQMRRMY